MSDHNFNTSPEILDKIRLLDTRGIGLDPCSIETGCKISIGCPPLMPHAERQRLIQRPFQSQFRVIAPKSHGGTTLGNSGSVPTEGHRTWQVSPADESYLRYGKFDGEGD